MHITYTKEVHLFREATGVEQDLIQQIVSTVEGAYLTDIHNSTTNPINNTGADVLTHVQEQYGKLMTHKILDHQ